MLLTYTDVRRHTPPKTKQKLFFQLFFYVIICSFRVTYTLLFATLLFCCYALPDTVTKILLYSHNNRKQKNRQDLSYPSCDTYKKTTRPTRGSIPRRAKYVSHALMSASICSLHQHCSLHQQAPDSVLVTFGEGCGGGLGGALQ